MKKIARIVLALALAICLSAPTALESSAHLKKAGAFDSIEIDRDFDGIKEREPILDLREPVENLLPPKKDPDTSLKPIIRPGGTIVPEPEEDEPSEPLPEEYCLRDDYIIFAQHQDKNGLCWNFAATMAASTTIMKATGEYYDFSELWTSITCYTPTKVYNQVGAGGSFSYQYKAMQQNGLMLESDLPYQTSYTVSNENADEYYDFYSRYSNNDLSGSLISDSSTSYSRKDVDKIKRHILEHGSLYMAFSFTTGFLEENGVYSLTPNQKNTTGAHAVSIIGWDDNYEKEFYLNGSDTPTVFKGAWIILNSYTETNGVDGISMIFYDDTNPYQIKGYRYEKNTDKSLYFYDKIEKGYAYPTAVKGKYYGDLTPETAETKQLNIFYDDVNLEYSYEISNGADINDLKIYLGNKDVTDSFAVKIDRAEKKFYISKDFADYGNYKVIISYGNGEESDTYLNNFFVTHGLMGEELEFDYEKNDISFTTGKNLEYYSYTTSDKDYIIYTDKLEGNISFLPIEQSVYSEKNMTMPTISYKITDGKSCTVTHTVTSNSGYKLDYNFTFIYTADTTLEQVTIYYDLGGGINNENNYYKMLASESSPLTLEAPTREGYTFLGWFVEGEDGLIAIPETDGIYTVDWNSIHHMGEAPTIYASSYYKKYYKNTNLLFVHALWERTECTVSWQNWNGDVLFEDKYYYGEIPAFSGEAPTREDDERYSYTFIAWSRSADATETNVIYTALFEATPKKYTITVNETENGSITASQEGPVSCQDSVTYIFAANEGYEVSDVKINGVSVGSINSYTFKDVHSNQTVDVKFIKTKTVVVWKNWNGDVLFEGKDYSADEPTKADDERYSYVFSAWLLSTSEDKTSVTYTASFRSVPKQFTITVNNSENGTVSTSHEGPITCLDSVTYVFTANDGYKIADVKINGMSVGAITNYTFADVHANQTLDVEFEKTNEAAVTAVIITLASGLTASAAAITLLAIKLHAFKKKVVVKLLEDTIE